MSTAALAGDVRGQADTKVSCGELESSKRYSVVTSVVMQSSHMHVKYVDLCTRTPHPRPAYHHTASSSGDCHTRPRDIQIKCSDSQRENGLHMRRPLVAFSTFLKKTESISSDRSAWDEVWKKNGLGELTARLKVSASGEVAVSDY